MAPGTQGSLRGFLNLPQPIETPSDEAGPSTGGEVDSSNAQSNAATAKRRGYQAKYYQEKTKAKRDKAREEKRKVDALTAAGDDGASAAVPSLAPRGLQPLKQNKRRKRTAKVGKSRR